MEIIRAGEIMASHAEHEERQEAHSLQVVVVVVGFHSGHGRMAARRDSRDAQAGPVPLLDHAVPLVAGVAGGFSDPREYTI